MSADSSQGSQPRNPLESIASEYAESVRGGRRGSIDRVLESNPEHESELRDLLPVIQQLENARKIHFQKPAGLATLGASRPERLGDFELVRQIGRGGMGVVFEAVQKSLGRKVALKVLPTTLLADGDQLRRFQREARMAASLHHTNIVPVFGVGEDQGFHYFVMQRIEGRGLNRVLSDPDVELTPEQVADLGRQAASALAYAHQQNLLHRDIKPGNLLVNDELDLWITDFGVAKAIESEAATRTGDVVGTLRYMAPEQIVGEADVRSDIYSLGVTLYELLAGRPAVDDTSIREAIVARRPAPTPPPLRQLNADVPIDLETILHAAMSADPDKRYQTADLLEQDLERFLAGEPISRRPMPLHERTIRWARQNPAIASLSAVSLVLLVSTALVSSAGALMLNSAVKSERESRENAEGIASAGLDAMDQILRHYTGGAGTLGTENSFSGTAPISSETAELLNELMPFYSEIEKYKDNAKLRQSTLNSGVAVADIHFNLGAYDDAIEAYSQTLENDSLSDLQRAKLINQKGFAYRMIGDKQAADREHEQAIALLASGPANDDKQFELARSHYLKGMRLVPGMGPTVMPPRELVRSHGPPNSRGPGGPGGPGRGGPGFGGPAGPKLGGPGRGNGFRRGKGENDLQGQNPSDHQRQAISILRELYVKGGKDPQNLSYGLALARSLRQVEARHFGPPPKAKATGQSKDEAIEILTDLQADFPSNETVLFELSDALADQRLSDVDAEDQENVVGQLSEAADNFSSLCNAHPNVPKYVNALVHTHFKLGVLRTRQAEELRGDERRRDPERPGGLDRPRGPEQFRGPERRPGHDPPRGPERMRDRGPVQELENLASESFRRAVDRYAVVTSKYSIEEAPGYHAWYALFLQRYAENALRSDLLDQATESFEQSAEIWERLNDFDPSENSSLYALPSVYSLLSDCYHRRGRFDDAEAAQKKGQRAMEELLTAEALDSLR